MALRITSIALVAAWILAVGARSTWADDFWGLSSLMTLPGGSHADCDACDDCHGPTRLAGDARGCDNHDCEPLSCGDRFGGGQPLGEALAPNLARTLELRRYCFPHCRCPTCHTWQPWGSVDLLMWWMQGGRVPPLVTTSPPTVPRAVAGVLGEPDTTILFGDQRVGMGMRTGGRLDVGTWTDHQRMLGLGGRFYGLGGEREAFSAISTGDPVLAQPFFNVLQDGEDALLVAFPDVTEGSITIRNSTDFLGAEAYGRVFFDQGHNYRVDLIGGFHFARLDDGLVKSDFITVVDPEGFIQVGTTLDVVDRFEARNAFYGGQLGFRGELRRGIFTLSSLAKISLGTMDQQVRISGSTTVTEPGFAPITTAGGLYAQPSNIGTFSRNRTVYIPEVNVNLGVDVTCRLRATVGYSFIWISEVALGSEHIDREVNLSQLQGGQLIGDARPQFDWQTSDFWLQGLNLGLAWSF